MKALSNITNTKKYIGNLTEDERYRLLYVLLGNYVEITENTIQDNPIPYTKNQAIYNQHLHNHIKFANDIRDAIRYEI